MMPGHGNQAVAGAATGGPPGQADRASLCIYVDVENVRRGAARLLNMPIEPFIVDPVALRRTLAQLAPARPGRQQPDWSAAKVVFFTGSPPNPDHASWVWYRPLRYLWTAADRVEVRDHPVTVARGQRREEPSWKQDAVDVLLAVTAVKDALEARYHSIIVVSGDSDLAPAVQACADQLGRLNVLTAAVEGTWKQDAEPPAIRLGTAVARELDMRVRMGEVAVHYADLFSIEDETGNTQARKFVEYLARSEPLTARRALIRAYLDAFWWWGNYERSDLCESLIRRWDSYLGKMDTDPRPGIGSVGHRRLLEALQAFDDAYPPGRDEDKMAAGDAAWETAGDAARELWRLLELDGELDQPLDRHVAALAEIYLAESHRFRAGDAHGVAAAAHYGRAAELFSANGERWNLAWVRCDWAALSYERGHLAEALRLCGAAEDLARNLGAEQDEFLDHELLAKLSVIAAMSCLADGPAADQQAGWAYAAAALRHACAFQVRPGAHPDEYTQEFYFDIRAKVGRLMELAGPGGRRHGLQVVVDGWRGLWPEEPGQLDLTARAAGGQADRRNDLLGPPPPTKKQLRAPQKADYASRIASLIDLLDEDGALDTLGWPEDPAAGR
jgi:hypothetical protein